MELAVRDNFIEFKDLLRCLFNQFVVNIATIESLPISILTRRARALNVPHRHRRVVGRDERLTICTLGDGIDVVLVDVCEGIFQLNWILMHSLIIIIIDAT